MDTKRILVFTYNFYPFFVGESQVVIKEVTDRLYKHGLEYHVLTARAKPSQLRTEWVGNTLVHRVGFGLLDITKAGKLVNTLSRIAFVPFASVRGAYLHRKHGCSEIWFATASSAIIAAVLHMCGMRVPYVISIHEDDPFRHMVHKWYAQPLRLLLRYAFAHADLIHVVSNVLADWVKGEGAGCPVVVLPSGLDLAHYKVHYTEEELSIVRAKANKQEGDTLLVTTAPLEHEFGVDTVLSALTELPHNMKCMVLGTGSAEAALRQQVIDQGTESRVTFVGAVAYADLPIHLRACDIFVCARRVPCPNNPLIEAMASYLPVVATQSGSTKNVLFDPQHNPDQPQTGWVVSADNPKQIASAVLSIKSQASEVSTVLANAHKLVESQHQWDRVAEEMYTRVFKLLLLARVQTPNE